MSTNAEITYAIQNDRPSITIRYSAQEEGESKPDLRDMLSQIQEAITEFQANKPQPKLLSNTEVVVQDVPQSTPATLKPQALPLADNNLRNSPQKFSQKPNVNSSSGKKKISEKQIATIRQNLRERDIPECAFCNTHGIKRIEDLPSGVAWHVICDHQY